MFRPNCCSFSSNNDDDDEDAGDHIDDEDEDEDVAMIEHFVPLLSTVSASNMLVSLVHSFVNDIATNEADEDPRTNLPFIFVSSKLVELKIHKKGMKNGHGDGRSVSLSL